MKGNRYDRMEELQMKCPKCEGRLERTFIIDSLASEIQQRCLNCGLHIREGKPKEKCPVCTNVICSCWGQKRSKEREREEVIDENN